MKDSYAKLFIEEDGMRLSGLVQHAVLEGMSKGEVICKDDYGFIYSADGKKLIKGANVEGAYWIPEGVEEIEHGALVGCKISTLHVPWTAHVHNQDQLVFSEDPEENEELMPCVYFWTIQKSTTGMGIAPLPVVESSRNWLSGDSERVVEAQ